MGTRAAIPPFICEICKIHLRGLMSSIHVMFYTVGYAMSILMGALLPWRLAIGVFGIFCIFQLIGLRVGGETHKMQAFLRVSLRSFLFS